MSSDFYMRPWTLADAAFVVATRNNPELMCYFRQNEPITLANQIKFMKQAEADNYNGYILMEDSHPRGVFALHGSELCIAAPLKYHAMGVNILKAMNPLLWMRGDVFCYNPALKIYLSECGFHVYDVQEKYCKKQGEWVGVVKICS